MTIDLEALEQRVKEWINMSPGLGAGRSAEDIQAMLMCDEAGYPNAAPLMALIALARQSQQAPAQEGGDVAKDCLAMVRLLTEEGRAPTSAAVSDLLSRAAEAITQSEKEVDHQSRGWVGCIKVAKELMMTKRSAEHFIEFALRHTLPVRASERTHEETYGMLKHHPAAKAWAAQQEQEDAAIKSVGGGE